MKRLIPFVKKHLFLAGVLLVIVFIGILFFAGRNQKPSYEIVNASSQDLVQTVSVTGKVRPAEAVDLAFERGGRINYVYVNVGDKVRAGAPLVGLENSELAAQILQAEAKVQELDPSRVQQKGAADIQKLYQQGLADAQDAVVVAKNALLTLSDIQYAHFTDSSVDSERFASAKEQALLSLFGQEDAGRWLAEFISPLKGGTFGKAQQPFLNAAPEAVEGTLQDVFASLQSVQKALDAVIVLSSFTATEKSDVSSAKTGISDSISAMVDDIQGIAVQKVANENSLQSISAQFSSAKARLQELQAQNAKTVLRAPLAGLVSKQEGKAGEIVSANVSIVSLISESQFEVEANIPEADIAKISIGDTASLTLDAYGSSVEFAGKVVSIDPAETVIDGVSTYATKVHFLEADDRVKSGMTANIDIAGKQLKGVLAIPQRAVTSRDGKKFVRILVGEKEKEIEVQTGFRGSNGYVEVVQGLNEGDSVILFSGK